ncbi:MAG: zf-HC2 domain-containing protein [Candidatus Korobacteraceae bacterium]
MTCSVAKRHMSSYLDGAVTRRQLTQMNEHLHGCLECSARLASLRRTQSLVGSLGRKVAPPELALRLRVAMSQEIANAQRSRWEMLRVRWENVFDAIMVPATAGVLTTLIVFGLLISFLYPIPVRAANDVPTMLYTPAELQSTPFELSMGGVNADSLVVEAYVGADGRVQDYRVLSAPEDAEAVLPQLKNMLIFTTFHPATAFGQPTSSRVVLTFSKVQVKG